MSYVISEYVSQNKENDVRKFMKIQGKVNKNQAQGKTARKLKTLSLS